MPITNRRYSRSKDLRYNLHHAIALEVTSNSSMVEHLFAKQKVPVQIRATPPMGHQTKTLLSTRAAHFYFEAGCRQSTTSNSSSNQENCSGCPISVESPFA